MSNMRGLKNQKIGHTIIYRFRINALLILNDKKNARDKNVKLSKNCIKLRIIKSHAMLEKYWNILTYPPVQSDQSDTDARTDRKMQTYFA